MIRMSNPTFKKKFAIANGESLTAAVTLEAQVDDTGVVIPTGSRLFAIIMPSTWTTANLTFQVSYDGVTYVDLYNSAGTEVAATAAASRCIVLDPAIFASLSNIKIRSGTSGTPVNQAQESILSLMFRAV